MKQIKNNLSILLMLLLMSLNVNASPLIWESSIGEELTDLSGNDDEETSVELSFDFPFDGVNYSTIFVGTNGAIQLGSLGDDSEIDYDLWEYMEEFVSDLAPIIAMHSDWDLTSNGTIHFNDFGHKAVFTWNEVGTHENEGALSTFQIQIFNDGVIYISMNGVLDGPEEDLLIDQSEGFVVGITSGNVPVGVDPGPLDLTTYFDSDAETFGRWCFNLVDSCGFNGNNEGLLGDINTEFNLDFSTVTFHPIAEGYAVNDVLFSNDFQ